MSFDSLVRLFERIARDFSWEMLVELLLIGLSVNWCASVLHGTRGTRLLRGLLILLVGVTLIVRVLAAQLGWTRLELLYRFFVTGLAFIALVAFQPELRRALIRAGDVRFLRRGTKGNNVIAALVSAAGHLSRNRHGALIAVQRDVGLANWTENGTPLNAEVTSNLLSSLFYPNSALHDLGVVLRDGRVLAAGCQFPMAEGGDVDPALGSRHRAAVGMSQETDALVLVVSEETGTISLADHGQLIRYLSLDDLERELTERLDGQVTARGGPTIGITRTDVKRFVRRLATVAPLTMLIWFLADQASLIRADNIQIALNVQHDAAVQVDIRQPQPPLYGLTLTGSTRQIEAVRALSDGGSWKVDWLVAPPYDRSSKLDERGLITLLEGLPQIRHRGVRIESVSPPTLEYDVHEVVTVAMPVQLETGTLRVRDVRIEPQTVQVSMRKGDLEKIIESKRIATVNLREALNGAAQDKLLTVSPAALDRAVGGFPVVRIEPPDVNVSLRFVSEKVTKWVKGIVVHVTATPQFLERYDLIVADRNEWLIEVELTGERSAIEGLRPQQVYAHVPLSDETPTPDLRSARVQFKLPAGVELVKDAPEVRYRLTPRDGSTP